MFDTTAIPLTLYTTTTYLATQDSGDSVVINGQWVKFQFENVVGIPNILAGCQTSADGISWFDKVKYDGNGGGESPLINGPGEYNILLQTKNRYWRPYIVFYANDPNDTGPGSGNSSSSSGQSAFSSSSNGGSASCLMRVGLTPGDEF